MGPAFREALARIVEFAIGVVAALLIVDAIRARQIGNASTVIAALYVVVVIVAGAALAAWIHTSRIGRPGR